MPRQSSESPHQAAPSRYLSRTRSTSDSYKPSHSPDAHTTEAQPFYHYPPSPTPNQFKRPANDHFDDHEHVPTVDKYIAFQPHQEGLDRKIGAAEGERSDIAAQLVGLQVGLDVANDSKFALMQEKDRVKAEKRNLLSSLDVEEQLEFGSGAGRRMVSKRIQRDQDE
jgi:hypothetical protein